MKIEISRYTKNGFSVVVNQVEDEEDDYEEYYYEAYITKESGGRDFHSESYDLEDLSGWVLYVISKVASLTAVEEHVVAEYAANRFIVLARALTKMVKAEVKLAVCEECSVDLSDLMFDNTYPLTVDEALKSRKDEKYINDWLRENGCKQVWEKGLTVDELAIIKTIANRFLSVARALAKHIDGIPLARACQANSVLIGDVTGNHDYPFTLEEAIRTYDYGDACFWLNGNGYASWSLSKEFYEGVKNEKG